MEPLEINIAFKIRIDGIQFKGIVEFQDTIPAFKNTRLKVIDETNELYEILIRKQIKHDHPYDLKPIIKEATQEAQQFVYVFSKVADIKIFDFKIIGYYLNMHFSDISGLFPNYNQSTSKITIHAGAPTLERIKNDMQKEYNIALLQQYYDASTISEPIGRFISLYTILLHNVGDEQKKVEQALLKIDPTIIETRRPDSKKKLFETIFTRLRNELSHKRTGVYLIDTHTEVKEQVTRFEELVKKIVLADAEN